MADLIWPAPAKLNLFLHIVGRRDDGYHLLQTVFQFLSIADSIQFTVRGDEKITRASQLVDVEEQNDLVVLAAQALQQYAQTPLGVDISVQKILPMGGGLGGGSSDAATTLVALNQLWELDLPDTTLADIGLKLGADVPVFVHGHAAWAEGVGEQLLPVELPEPWYLVIHPKIHVPTEQLFAATELTRDVRAITIRDYLAGGGINVFESVAKTRYPVIAKALDWLSHASGKPARMTGTGSCIFVDVESEAQANELAQNVPHGWQSFSAKGLNQSPLVDAVSSYKRT